MADESNDWVDVIFNNLVLGRYYPEPPLIAPGEPAPIQLDPRGRVRVVIEPPIDPSQAGLRHLYSTTAEGGDGDTVVNRAAGLLRFWGQSRANVDVYVQIFDTTPPIVGGVNDVPVVSYLVKAGASFDFNYELCPRPFATGIVWGVSSSPEVYVGLNNIFFVEGVYQDPA